MWVVVVLAKNSFREGGDLLLDREGGDLMMFLGVFRADIRSLRERVGVANCEERRKK
jgi:hypothetical protein